MRRFSGAFAPGCVVQLEDLNSPIHVWLLPRLGSLRQRNVEGHAYARSPAFGVSGLYATAYAKPGSVRIQGAGEGMRASNGISDLDGLKPTSSPVLSIHVAPKSPMDTDPPTKTPKPDGHGGLKEEIARSPTQDQGTSASGDVQDSGPDEEFDPNPTKH